MSLSYRATHRTISQTVNILGATEISSAVTLDDRLAYLPMLQVALNQEPQLTGLQVGYDTGEYFIVRPLVTEQMRKQFHAPDSAALVVDNISREPGGKPQLERLWSTWSCSHRKTSCSRRPENSSNRSYAT